MPNSIIIQCEYKSDMSVLDRFIAAIKARLDEVAAFNKKIENGSRALNEMLTQAATILGARQMGSYMHEAEEAARAQNQLVQAMRQGGSYSASNIAALKNQAAALQKVTNYSDDEITSAQARIAAYGANIDQTKLLTRAAADLAAGQRTGISEAAAFISRALAGDNMELSRLGITLDSTKDRATALAEAIERRFGGQAQAALGFPELREARTNFDEARKAAGNLSTGFLPAIAGFSDGLAKGVTWLSQMVSMMGELVSTSDSLRSIGTTVGYIAAGTAAILGPLILIRAIVVWLPVLINPLRSAFVALAGVDFLNAIRGLQALSSSASFGWQNAIKLATWGEKLSGIFAVVGAGLAGWQIGTFVNQLKIADRTVQNWITLGLWKLMGDTESQKWLYQAEAGAADEQKVRALAERVASLRGQDDKESILAEYRQMVAEADAQVKALQRRKAAAEAAPKMPASSMPIPTQNVPTFSTKDEADLERLSKLRIDQSQMLTALENGQADAIIARNQALDESIRKQERANALLTSAVSAREKIAALEAKQTLLGNQFDEQETRRATATKARNTFGADGKPQMTDSAYASQIAEIDQKEREITGSILQNVAEIGKLKDEERDRAEAAAAAEIQLRNAQAERLAGAKQLDLYTASQGKENRAALELAAERVTLEAQLAGLQRDQAGSQARITTADYERVALEARLQELSGERAGVTGPAQERVDREIELATRRMADLEVRRNGLQTDSEGILGKILSLRRQIAENVRSEVQAERDLADQVHNQRTASLNTTLESTRSDRQTVEQTPYSAQQHQRPVQSDSSM